MVLDTKDTKNTKIHKEELFLVKISIAGILKIERNCL